MSIQQEINRFPIYNEKQGRPRRGGAVTQLVADILVAGKREKKIWLLPLVFLLLLLVGVSLLVALTGPLAPFIYPLF